MNWWFSGPPLTVPPESLALNPGRRETKEGKGRKGLAIVSWTLNDYGMLMLFFLTDDVFLVFLLWCF